ncbi:MAG: hypothetical protein AXA67_11125 [Methylothermaceae bacteria B42]|nr:MAG: hypothetical protein AXA67_11125 [Methylothermaceae bacteria B42]
MTLALVSARKCQKTATVQAALPSYDLQTGNVLLPSVEVRFPNSRQQYYLARLQRVHRHPMTFKLTLAEPAAGERYTVENTVFVNTLIGYGEIREQSSFPSYIRSKFAGGDILWGTDLGLPVTLPDTSTEGRELTLYLFGDTDQLDLAYLNKTGQVRKFPPNPELDYGEFFYGPKGPFEGDAIGLSADDDPTDGVQLFHVYRNEEKSLPRVCEQADPLGFRPVYLDGIHAGEKEIEKGLLKEMEEQKIPEDKLPKILRQLPAPACVQKYPNTTPTGAWTIDDKIFMVAGIQNMEDLLNARSYIAVSHDNGLNWTVINNGKPFSQGGPLAKFIHAFGLEVDARDYQDPVRSGPCKLPLPETDDTRGMLLFGTGLWKASDVYLAFVSRADLLKAANNDKYHISPRYFAGTDYVSRGKRCWSTSEADAKAIIVAGDLSNYTRFENACGTSLTSAGVGYPKPIHVKQTLADGKRIDRLVMLLSPAYKGITEDGQPLDADLGTVLVTGDPWRPWIWNVAVTPGRHNGNLPSEHHFRPLPVPPDPDSGMLPTTPHCRKAGIPWRTVSGYAPLLIDRYTRVSDDGQGVDLYFLISRSNVPGEPNDNGPETVDAYHYIVDVMRTTLRPLP